MKLKAYVLPRPRQPFSPGFLNIPAPILLLRFLPQQPLEHVFCFFAHKIIGTNGHVLPLAEHAGDSTKTISYHLSLRNAKVMQLPAVNGKIKGRKIGQ